jgi:hypothetical protein
MLYSQLTFVVIRQRAWSIHQSYPEYETVKTPLLQREFPSTNRAESFNALVKSRFVKPRNYSEGDIILGSSEFVRHQVLRIRRARYGIGERWLLWEEFSHL